MNSGVFRATRTFATILFIMLSMFQPVARASSPNAGFSEHFDGTSIDAAKWAVQENGNMSGNSAYGGKVQVADSNIILSSEGSSFPCVTTTSNPFPTSGDFAVVFDITYTKISDWGNGLWISNGQFIVDRNSSIPVILQVWAHCLDYDQAAIFVNLLGKQVFRAIIYGWEPAANTQTFRLERHGSTYTLWINGIEVASGESQIRPDTMGFGHPPSYYIPFTPIHVESVVGGWSTFKIDYFKVLPQTRVTAYAVVSSAALGFRVDFSGTLTSAEGKPLSDKNIVLSYQTPGVASWNYFTSATTNSQGEYSATWLPSATGNFIVKAEWKGDDALSGSSDSKNLSVTRGTGETLFLAESNSTLSALAFNSTSREISFSVSGQSGTKGYVRFLVSKTLMDNVDFQVYLDGSQIECNITSEGNFLSLLFHYNHSTHNVLIRLQLTQTAIQSPSLLLQLSSPSWTQQPIESSQTPDGLKDQSIIAVIMVSVAFSAVAVACSIAFGGRRKGKPS